MSKPKLYDKRETLRMDLEMDAKIEAFREFTGLRRGEALRRLIASGMRHEALKGCRSLEPEFVHGIRPSTKAEIERIEQLRDGSWNITSKP